MVYVNYLVQKGFTFILHEELYSAAKIQNMMRGSLLAVTSLKLMSCDLCTQPESDVMALNIPQTGLTNTYIFISLIFKVSQKKIRNFWEFKKKIGIIL